MIQIKRATKADLVPISVLMNRYGKMSVSPELLNRRDLAVKAIDTETGALIGFAWAGLMAQNTLVYIDKVVIHPEYAKRGVCNLMYKELLTQSLKLGARTAFGIIKRDKYHDKAAINALKMAFAADHAPYTYVYGEANHIMSELSMLEAS